METKHYCSAADLHWEALLLPVLQVLTRPLTRDKDPRLFALNYTDQMEHTYAHFSNH